MDNRFQIIALTGILSFSCPGLGNQPSFAQDKVSVPVEVLALLTKAKNTENQKTFTKIVTMMMELYPKERGVIADKAISIYPAAGEDIRGAETDMDILAESFEKETKNETPNVGNFFGDHSGFFNFGDWKGSAEMGFASASGDTNAQALTGGFRANRVFNKSWEHAFKLDINFAKANGETSQEKMTSDYQIYYRNWDRGYLFGLGTFEYDKFSGFDYRLTQSFGAGYSFFDRPDFKWSIEAGPGARENKAKIGPAEVDFVGTVNTDLRYWIQPEISIGTKLKTAYGTKRFTLSNVADIKARINDRFSARFSFEANYDSVVPLNTSKMDTLLKATIIYDF